MRVRQQDLYPVVWINGSGVKVFNCSSCGCLNGYPVSESSSVNRVFRECRGKCGARYSALRGEVVLEKAAVEQHDKHTNERYTGEEILG